jgi:hypothetical protein
MEVAAVAYFSMLFLIFLEELSKTMNISCWQFYGNGI